MRGDGRAVQPFRTGESVSWQADGTYLNESLTGNRPRSAPNVARGERGHDGVVHERGISSLKACVVCGPNDPGVSFCRLTGRGWPTDEELAAWHETPRLTALACARMPEAGQFQSIDLLKPPAPQTSYKLFHDFSITHFGFF